MRKIKVFFMSFILVLVLSLFLFACSEPKDCEHSWGNEEILEEASCISEGSIRYTCNKCQETKLEKTEKTGHQTSTEYIYDDKEHYLYCLVCQDPLEKKPHSIIDDEIEKEPTAYEPGIMKTKCSSCSYQSTREIAPTEHKRGEKYQYDKDYHWYTCIVHEDCSVMIQKSKHTLVEGEIIKEATEDEDGLRKISCQECDYEGTVAIPANAHIKGEQKWDGTYHWYTCSRHDHCPAELEKEIHSWKETSRINASCTEKGSVSYECTGCAAVKTETLEPLNHDIEEYPAQNPTCTEVGWEAYESCKRCSYSTKVEMEAIGHNYELINTDALKHYLECSHCRDKKEATAHEYSSWIITTPATLYENGVETKCCSCGHLGTETRILSTQASFKDDFSVLSSSGVWKYGTITYLWGASESFEFTPFTQKNEAEDGWMVDGAEVKSGWIYANQMLAIAYTVTEKINISSIMRFIGGAEATRLALRVAVKNQGGMLYANPSFYGTDSNTLEVSLCHSLNLGDTLYFIFSNEAASNPEAYPKGALDIILKPVTYQEGYQSDDENHWKVCDIHSECSIKFDLQPHEWELIETTSTCTEAGDATYQCSICKKTKTVPLPATGHSFEDYEFENEDGHYQICSKCGTSSELLPHNMIDNGIQEEPTADQNGIMNTICTVCGYTSTRTIPALSHISSDIYDKDDDYHWHTCSAHPDCGVKLDLEKHSWQEISNTATCTEDGILTYECSVCGKPKEEVVSAAHLYGELIAQTNKTCTTDGMLAHYQCTRCQSLFNEDKESVTEEDLRIPAGHELTSYDAKSPTCTEVGWDAYEACENCDYTTKVEKEALGHTYEIWKTTTLATLYQNGIETIYCSTCDTAGTETRGLSAQADFKNDFSVNSSDGIWKYGSVAYTWGDQENFDFTALTNKTEAGDGFATDGIEIKSGWINAGQMLGIGYMVTEDVPVNARIRFVGGVESTRLALRIGVKNQEGVLYGNPSFHRTDTNVLEVTVNYELKAGDTIYFIFSNEAGSNADAYPNGELNITLKQNDSFRKNFSTEASDGIWKYGSVAYSWGEQENFDFTALTNKTEAGDGWTADGIEIKSGWINAGQMLGIGYTVAEDTQLKALIRFVGGVESTRLALRIGIKNQEDVLYGNPSFHGTDTNVLETTVEYELKAGDTIYFIFSNEAGSNAEAYPNGALDILIFN